MEASGGRLSHSLLRACGVSHGFGLRDSVEPRGLVRPRQVHGSGVSRVGGDLRLDRLEADAVVSTVAGVPIGVVTADCVPVLLASRSGAAVAAIHAGWRGLAAGVVAAGARALQEASPDDLPLFAALGPHIGVCCYEVDAPVLTRMRDRFGADLEDALQPAHSGVSDRFRLDLGALVRRELLAVGLEAGAIGDCVESCTACNPMRFHSFRRDGPRAGRLVHFVAAGRESLAGSAEEA